MEGGLQLLNCLLLLLLLAAVLLCPCVSLPVWLLPAEARTNWTTGYEQRM
jgi:hypothetical protein